MKWFMAHVGLGRWSVLQLVAPGHARWWGWCGKAAASPSGRRVGDAGLPVGCRKGRAYPSALTGDAQCRP